MAAKPYSLRLDEGTIRRLAEEAARRHVPARTLAQELVEEGLRMRRHPGIVFRDGPAGRRPGLRRGPDVWEVVAALRANDGSVPAVAEVLAVPEREVRLALAYHGDHGSEIDDWIRANDEEAARAETAWRRQQAVARA
ncbi:MAG: CopG family transcriptional regulator [Chloroflexi bacterium]|nr:CopG family transcriptional regulator [Chloroflexota bacterium]